MKHPPALSALTLLLLLSSAARAQQPQPSASRDVTFAAPDETTLAATYYDAGRPGPAVLLLHMCNDTRESWKPLGPQLAAAGIHALALDYRGYGESGGARADSLPPQEAQALITGKWPGDIDAAYEFLRAQPGVDGSRIGVAGGSCGVTHAVQLASRQSGIRSLALLAGTVDPQGIAFLTSTPGLPVFAAAAAGDRLDPDMQGTMRWILALSGNPRNRFQGFRDDKHGTEMFGPHPELAKQMTGWFTDTLVTRPADPKAAVEVKNSPVREFWRKAVSPDGVAEAVQMFYDLLQTQPRTVLFREGPMNQLGYFHLQAGRAEEAIRLFRLNTLVYPRSANTWDSLGDAHLAAGQHELALRMSERAIELLEKDPSSEARRQAIRESAEAKIAKLTDGPREKGQID